MSELEYLKARVSALEVFINNIIDFNQIKHDRHQYSIPSDANFWCDQMKQLRVSVEEKLNKAEREVMSDD